MKFGRSYASRAESRSEKGGYWVEGGCFLAGIAAFVIIMAMLLPRVTRCHPLLALGAAVVVACLVGLVQWWVLRSYRASPSGEEPESEKDEGANDEKET